MSGVLQPALPGLAFFDRRAASVAQSRPAADRDLEEKRELRLFCAACRHPVTHHDERIDVNGAHEHRCTNPGGYAFDIGCFHEAGGCAAAGEATTAHTWFQGYAWRIALCASCERHLGWRFEGPLERFFGLILGRLTSAAGSAGG